MKGTRAMLALSALLALPAFAEDPVPSPTTPPAKTDKNAVEKPASKPAARAGASGASNMIVTRDPETGELRPATPAERQKLLGRRPLVAVEHRVVTLPDGTSMVELGDADMSYAVAARGAGGTVVQGCVHGDAAAKAAVSATPTPSAPTGKSDR